MKPVTLAEAEEDLRLALAGGDRELIDTCAALVDALDHPTPPPSTLGVALWYADHGLHTFPVAPGAKVPYPFTKGVKDATLDPDVLREWWDRWPDANVAIATGWLVDVVDFDGPTAHRSRLDHWEEFETVPGEVLAKVSTPRPGGVHWYVKAAAGVKNGKHLYPGIDYRALGGYVVAPPSTLDDRPDQVAGTYRFLDAAGLAGLVTG